MVKIKIDQFEFPMRFSVGAIKQLQDKYGRLEHFTDKLQDLDEAAWILALLINEGRKYEAFTTGGHAILVTAEQMGTLLTLDDVNGTAIGDALLAAFNESCTNGKNMQAEDLMKTYQVIQSGLLTDQTNP